MDKTLLQGKFYVSAAETDLKKTFRRIKKRLREEEEARSLAEAEAKVKVSPIIKVAR